MNDVRAAQQNETETGPQVFVGRHHHQWLVCRFGEVNQVDD